MDVGVRKRKHLIARTCSKCERGILMQACVCAGASHIIGLEASGEVAEVGEGVTGFKKGDRVMTLLDGGG
jgi:threonine dehydrogenase-like Zn-dependent dehydrogenase